MKKLLLIGILLISVAIVAGEVSHPASQISFGDFPSGNYSFDGNVGIGTSTPEGQLTIAGGSGEDAIVNMWSNAAGINSDKWRMIITDADQNFKLQSYASGEWNDYFQIDDSTGQLMVTSGISVNPRFTFIDDANTGIWNPIADNWAVSTGGVEQLRIDGSGNVGIGTSNPGYKLSIVESVSGEANALIYSVVANQNVRLILKTAAGTGNPYIKFDSNNTDFSIGVDQDDSDKFKFSATNGFGTSLMTIQRDGNVGIGTTNPGSYRLYVSGGEAYCDQTTCWNDASDIIFKKDIIDLNYGLDEIMQIEPRRFVYKKNNQMGIGMIAQELETIIPEVVSGKNGSMGIAYGSLTPVIINAIQEQQSEIQKLKKQNDELKQIVCLDHPRAEVCK